MTRMKLFNRIYSQTLFLLLTIFFVFTAVNAFAVSDRLIIAINTNSFSQSEMQTYFYLKDVVAGKNSFTKLKPVWRQKLQEYAIDMVMLNEVDRIGGFSADAQQVNQYLRKFKRLAQAKLTASYRRSYSDNFLKNMITNAMKIRDYQKSRQWNSKQKKMPSWFQKLYDASKVRYFEDAEKYVKLN